MKAKRKVTKFTTCEAHTFAGMGRGRLAEMFCEGGPAFGGPCAGAGCSFSPGLDLFEPSICDRTFDTRPGSLFAWGVNGRAVA